MALLSIDWQQLDLVIAEIQSVRMRRARRRCAESKN
jgi:hypothetical protein